MTGNDRYSASRSWHDMLAAFLLRYDCNLALMAMVTGYAGYRGWLRWFHMLAVQFGCLCWLSYISWLDVNADFSCYVGLLY
jgi:hypothetical protein